MNLSVFVGDIADAEADAVCTSTNPSLSLMMGTGGSVRARGGFEILRACEAMVESECRRTGRKGLAAGSAHVTTAGRLPHRIAIHCVASDSTHRSSPPIISACVRNALRSAKTNGCSSVAMPIFGSGHANTSFDHAVLAMANELGLRDADAGEVILVVMDAERAEEASAILKRVLGIDVKVRQSQRLEPTSSGWMAGDE